MPEKGTEDAIFTFNGEEMKNFFKSMGEGVEKIGGSMKNMTQKIATGVKSGIGHFAKLGLVFVGLRKLIAQMPEVGQAFGIAKDIALRNFLWPLRKAIMPMLQSMLDWVRDHRAAFVKWGQVVANVFKAIVSVVKSVFYAVKSIIDGIMRGISRALGGAAGTAEDMINLLQFKVTGILMFFGNVIKMVGEKIGDFMAGFLPMLQPAIDAIGKLVESFSKLFETLFGHNWDWKKLGESIGGFVGTVLTGILDTINLIVNGLNDIAMGVKSLFGSKDEKNEAMFKRFQDYAKKETTGFGWEIAEKIDPKRFRHLKSFTGQTEEEQRKRFMRGDFKEYGWAPAVDDAIITPRGEIVRTDPADYILAMKNPAGIATPSVVSTIRNMETVRETIRQITPVPAVATAPERRSPITFEVSIGPFHVTSQGGDIREEARKVAETVYSTFKSRVLGDMLREGA